MGRWTRLEMDCEYGGEMVIFTIRSVKHRGEDVGKVADDDPNYLRWLLREQDLDTDDESAIESYRKSLELNPDNSNAAKMLKKLGAKSSLR